MTNKEAVIAACSPYTVDNASIEKALLDNNLSGSDTYVAANKSLVNAVAFDVLFPMLALSSVGEGGFSISFKPDELKAKLRTIGNPEQLLLVPVEVPTISDASELW